MGTTFCTAAEWTVSEPREKNSEGLMLDKEKSESLGIKLGNDMNSIHQKGKADLGSRLPQL
jgi:hypothetical protein